VRLPPGRAFVPIRRAGPLAQPLAGSAV